FSPASFFVTDPPSAATIALSLHDALPISRPRRCPHGRTSARRPASPRARRGSCPHRRCGTPPRAATTRRASGRGGRRRRARRRRSEEHTSELQSRENLVCRLLLEKKNTGL